MRLGCPLALTIAAALVLAFTLMRWGSVDAIGRNLGLFVIMGAPFAVLAIAGVRDWLAWLVGAALMASLWAYNLYDISRGQGVNFLLGFFDMFVAPVLISLLCLLTAGLRGKIVWGSEESKAVMDEGAWKVDLKPPAP